LARGDTEKGVECLEHAIALERAGVLEGSETPSARVARAAAYENLGVGYMALDDNRRALENLAMAVSLVPEAATTRSRYAEALAFDGAMAKAAAEYERAGVPVTHAAEALVRRAVIDQERGNATGMRKDLEAAYRLLPSFEPSAIALIRLDIKSHDTRAALQRLREAQANGLDEHVAQAHLAWIYAVEGETTKSRRAIKAIPEGVRAQDARVAATLELMRYQESPRGALPRPLE